MITTTLQGFIVRETEKAVAFCATAKTEKPLWIPRGKIAAMQELDDCTRAVRVAGEAIARNGIPHTLDVDMAWLEKVTR